MFFASFCVFCGYQRLLLRSAGMIEVGFGNSQRFQDIARCSIHSARFCIFDCKRVELIDSLLQLVRIVEPVDDLVGGGARNVAGG